MIIVDFEVILREFLGLANLPKIKVFSIYELSEVVVISGDKNLIFAALQVVMPSLKGFNNSQKLLIIDLVPYFYKNYFP